MKPLVTAAIILASTAVAPAWAAGNAQSTMQIGSPVGPAPVVPPVANPGQPILISCTINVGCITRPYPPSSPSPPRLPGGPPWIGSGGPIRGD